MQQVIERDAFAACGSLSLGAPGKRRSANHAQRSNGERPAISHKAQSVAVAAAAK